jgi:hypothetical protein
MSHAPYCQEIDSNNPPHMGPQPKFEDLGLIDGVEVRSRRESYYTSVPAKLSGAPQVRVYKH